MQKKIIILPQDVVEKIAAGEVIQRPASVVKELIENSLDAKASNIIIEIKDSGKKLIKVTDDGEGMSKEDLLLAIKRHATSKIKDSSDLQRINTLGFRGEALPSIASVSKLNIASNNNTSSIGHLLTTEALSIKSIKPLALNKGTIVEVRDLFYNTPARLKFLKSEKIELSHIQNVILQYCLAYYSTDFKLIHNNKQLINTKLANKSLIDRILMFYGKSLKDNLLYFEKDYTQLKFFGYLTHPYKTPQAKLIYTFVNKRPITSRLLNKAIKDAYTELTPHVSFFSVFLFIELEPSLIDVNIHPTKAEIKFFNESMVYKLLKDAIIERLQGENFLKVDTSSDKKEEFKLALDKYLQRKHTHLPAMKIQTTLEKPITQQQLPELEQPKEEYFVPLGQIYNTFIIACDKEENILIIDQHAIEERILFERLKKEKPISQKLLFPIVIDLTPKQKEILLSNIEPLKNVGFEIESFGSNAFVIRQVPYILKDKINKEVMLEIIEELSQVEKIDFSPTGKVIAAIACKLALKAGTKLQDSQIKNIINDFSKLQKPYSCPHGRPFVIKITKEEIERRFNRR